MSQHIHTHPAVRKFLEQVCANVRARAVHDDIRTEMLNHLEELYSEKMEEGLPESEAIEAAVLHMGDPELVGKQLNDAHRPVTEWGVVLLFTCLMLIGGVTVFSLHYAVDGGVSILHKIVFAAAGAAFMGMLYFVDYRRLLNFSSLLYAAAIFMMAYALWQGTSLNGARQYVSFGPYIMNVYSAVPYLLIAAAAGMLYRDKARLTSASNPYDMLLKLGKDAALYLIVPSCFFAAAPASVYLHIYLISVTILLMVYRQWKVMVAGAGFTGALLLITQAMLNPDLLSNATERYFSFLHRTEESSFYTMRSLEAINDGGWWGQGFGVAAGRLPYAASEMTYSYLVYSLGWMFGIIVAGLALLFLLRTATMSMQLKDGYAKSLIIGLTSVLAVQYLWTLLMCIGVLPILGGMQMPIMNWTSGTFIELGAVGLMLGAYRRKEMLGSSTWVQPRTEIRTPK